MKLLLHQSNHSKFIEKYTVPSKEILYHFISYGPYGFTPVFSIVKFNGSDGPELRFDEKRCFRPSNAACSLIKLICLI